MVSAASLRSAKLEARDVFQAPPGPFAGPDVLGDGAGLVATLLTGGRPQLLGATLARMAVLREAFPALRLVAYVNQADRASCEQLERAEVPYTESPIGSLTSIGHGTSLLARRAFEADRRLWLHLEDDWLLDRHLAEPTLREAAALLHVAPEIKQVRLRKIDERVLNRHQVTQRALGWTLHDRHARAAAHWTFNPSLVRLGAAEPALALCEDFETEEEAQRRIHHRFPGLLVAQLSPGIFQHGGEEHSLRKRRTP